MDSIGPGYSTFESLNPRLPLRPYAHCAALDGVVQQVRSLLYMPDHGEARCAGREQNRCKNKPNISSRARCRSSIVFTLGRLHDRIQNLRISLVCMSSTSINIKLLSHRRCRFIFAARLSKSPKVWLRLVRPFATEESR